MKRTNTESAGNVLKSILSNAAYAGMLHEQSIVEAWQKNADAATKSLTKDIRFYNGTMFITMKSSVAADYVRLNKTKFMEEINKELGDQIVKEIKVK